MKKITFLALLLALVAFPVLAAEQRGINGSEAGMQNSGYNSDLQVAGQNETENGDEKDSGGSLIAPGPKREQNQLQAATQVQNQGEDLQVNQQEQIKAKNVDELKQMIKERKQQIDQELQSLSNKTKQKVFENQNQVREAVHAFLAAEDLVGGIGQQVSAIAREFNNSVEKTILAEEKIQSRNKIKEFFLGGDKVAALELKQEADQNRIRIQELKQLKGDCECEQEVMELIEEKIQLTEQEQTRLEQLVLEQLEKKGLFGWLFGWLKK